MALHHNVVTEGSPWAATPTTARKQPRIVALVLVSDGHVCSSEFDILEQLGAERELGLEPQLLPHIGHTPCEEPLAGGYETGSLIGKVDDSTLASLMAEVSDPVLQETVLRLSLAAARAYGHLADGETMVVKAARRHWQLVDGEEPSAPASARLHAACPEPLERVQGRAAATTCITKGWCCPRRERIA